MSDHPVLFSGPMVSAILSGRKTQTRRLLPCRWRVGDRLWVRETFACATPDVPGAPVLYAADPGTRAATGGPNGPWRPSIFMPRWASRLTLAVDDVRTELLHDITEDDAVAEGIAPEDAWSFRDGPDGTEKVYSYTRAFARLWESINGKRAPWASNPEVSVTTFRVVSGE